MKRKFCKDCKHCIPDLFLSVPRFDSFAQCAKTDFTKPARDPVTGKTRKGRFDYCSGERSKWGTCGPAAKLFEAKKAKDEKPHG